MGSDTAKQHKKRRRKKRIRKEKREKEKGKDQRRSALPGLQRPVNCQPCYWGPTLRVGSTISRFCIFFQFFVFFPKKSLFKKTVPTLQRPLNCQPRYWAPNFQSRKLNLIAITFSLKICHFSNKSHFFKNSVGNRVPPKQSLLISLIIFMCATFNSSKAFW